MTILSIVQRVTRRLGISVPSAVVGNSDAQILQLVELANDEGRELSSRGRWQGMIRENVFDLVTTVSQGTMSGDVVDDGDYDYIINNTFWNRTTDLPVMGPVSAAQWQTLQTFPVTGPYQQWRIIGKNLYFDPVPPATDQCAFEYMSTSWCESSGGAGQSEWLADTDTGLLDENLMYLGLVWRWKSEKGLEYGEDFNSYERQVLDAIGRDGGSSVKDLNGSANDYREAGIIVPIGSWNP